MSENVIMKNFLRLGDGTTIIKLMHVFMFHGEMYRISVDVFTDTLFSSEKVYDKESMFYGHDYNISIMSSLANSYYLEMSYKQFFYSIADTRGWGWFFYKLYNDGDDSDLAKMVKDSIIDKRKKAYIYGDELSKLIKKALINFTPEQLKQIAFKNVGL